MRAAYPFYAGFCDCLDISNIADNTGFENRVIGSGWLVVEFNAFALFA
jgi:hypothetical protein